MDFKVYHLGRFIKQVDCNDCAYLNITEKEQKSNHNKIHYCNLYNNRVIHRTNNLIHNTRLYPCDKCYKDEHKHFKARENGL